MHYDINVAKGGAHYFKAKVDNERHMRVVANELAEKFPECEVTVRFKITTGTELSDWKYLSLNVVIDLWMDLLGPSGISTEDMNRICKRGSLGSNEWNSETDVRNDIVALIRHKKLPENISEETVNEVARMTFEGMIDF